MPSQRVLALLDTGFPVGFLMTSGAGHAQCAPTFEGYSLPQGVQQLVWLAWLSPTTS